MIQCLRCGRSLDRNAMDQCMASISGSIMGDEYIETYYFCDRCQVYTLEIPHDRFLDDDEVSLRGPISKLEGDAKVELIRECSEPWNKKCRCDPHQSYFDAGLD